VGDGPVELKNVKAVGGIAVGVASDEKAGFGLDEAKRERLIKAGADIIIPDFAEAQALADYLFPAR
ncbi:MAG: HAD family hydrolase, partial [Candidatus Hydrogenedentes bacterium]|nr:HAD family hydrolase [Candidatus Hydrogenedentota bacterium]